MLRLRGRSSLPNGRQGEILATISLLLMLIAATHVKVGIRASSTGGPNALLHMSRDLCMLELAVDWFNLLVLALLFLWQ